MSTATMFTRAVKEQEKLRLALLGPSGSGKTYSALRIATALKAGPIALIDTERRSARKYAHEFEFNTVELDTFHPQAYINAIEGAAAEGHGVVIVDSLSHAWAGKEGVLEFVDTAKVRHSGSSFSAWREATPLHNSLVDALLIAPMHVIVTMRVKTEYAQEKDEKGKTIIRKVGLQPIQRDGLEYEFDIVADLDQDNTLAVTKTRCSALRKAVIREPGAELAETLLVWLNSGEPLADEKLQQQLDKAIAALAKADPADPPVDWAEMADKYAKREFNKGRALLTVSEMEKTLAAFAGHLAKLTEKKAEPVEEPVVA